MRFSPFPVSVSAGEAVYPSDEEFDAALAKTSDHVYKVPAVDLALQIGNSKCLNIVLLGAVSALFDIAPEIWEDVLKERVKPKFVELNLNAFHAGRNWMKENM